MTWRFVEGTSPPRYPQGNVIPRVTEEQVHNVYTSIDPDVLGYVKYIGLRSSLDDRQVIIYRNFCDDLSAQFLDVLLTDNSPEHLPIENSIRAIFVHELSEPSDPVEFFSASVANVEAEFPGIKWFGGTDEVLVDGQ